MSGLPGPVIILVRPQLAENIGMCARAMANFGLSRLRLVSPRGGWPQKARLKKGAVQAASGASHILEGAEIHADLSDAIGDLTTVYATTARAREQAKPVLAPSQAMAALGGGAAQAGIVFGPERTGLDSDEISLASAIVSFPVNPAFPSLNLAQAVLLVGYEWFRHGASDAPPFEMPRQSPPASRASLLSFFSFAEDALTAARFFDPPHKRQVMVRNFRNIIHRLDPSEQDVRTLRGAFNALIRGPSQLGMVGAASPEGVAEGISVSGEEAPRAAAERRSE